MVVHPLKQYSEMPATKEVAKEQKTPDDLLKKNATFYKSSGKLDKGKRRETHVSNFMKNMLKKLDFTSRCNPTSASGKAVVNASTDKKPAKVLRRSRKIHPETCLYVSKSYNYEVKNMSYDEGNDKDVTLEHENHMSPHAGMLKKEIASSRKFPNRPLNSQPGGKKAYWIKTDADYLVLEF